MALSKQERRRWKRIYADQHLECDCVPRILTPVLRLAVCSQCTVSQRLPPIVMPTTAELGSLTTVLAGCRFCTGDLEVTVVVEEL